MTKEELNAVRGYVGNIQAIKDAHNTEKLPINYGTICTITAKGWELIEELKKNDWVPCSERQPNEGGDYFVTTIVDVGGKEPVREVRKNFFCILSQKWLYENDTVVAWMPLPKPYEPQESEKQNDY